jgi:Uma2 family endonuclease
MQTPSSAVVAGSTTASSGAATTNSSGSSGGTRTLLESAFSDESQPNTKRARYFYGAGHGGGGGGGIGRGAGGAGGVAVASSGGVGMRADVDYEAGDYEEHEYEPITEQPALASSHQPSEVVSPTTKKTSKMWDQLQEFNSMSQDEQASTLPFCIAPNVTLKRFHAKCNQNESRGGSRWEFEDGKVWIYDLPLAPHESAAAEVTYLLRAQMGQHFRDIKPASSRRCDNNVNNWSYEPDGTLTVRGFRPGRGHADAADSEGNRWPNIIVEVAYTESEAHVHRKAGRWLNTATQPNHGVQQVIVIKIGANMRVDGNRTMMAWRYERGGDVDEDANPVPEQTIEFGNHGPGNGATTVGVVGMQLHIPVTSVYLPIAPPADLPGPLVLDLFYIRRTIEEDLGELV